MLEEVVKKENLHAIQDVNSSEGTYIQNLYFMKQII